MSPGPAALGVLGRGESRPVLSSARGECDGSELEWQEMVLGTKGVTSRQLRLPVRCRAWGRGFLFCPSPPDLFLPGVCVQASKTKRGTQSLVVAPLGLCSPAHPCLILSLPLGHDEAVGAGHPRGQRLQPPDSLSTTQRRRLLARTSLICCPASRGQAAAGAAPRCWSSAPCGCCDGVTQRPGSVPSTGIDSLPSSALWGLAQEKAVVCLQEEEE